MDLSLIQPYLPLLQKFVSPDLWQKGLAVFGALSLIGQLIPKLVGWGVPAAIKTADWVARVALGSPLKPLILWQAPAIVKFLQDLRSALEQIVDTFESRLEKDISDAAAQPPSPPSQAAPGGPEKGVA